MAPPPRPMMQRSTSGDPVHDAQRAHQRRHGALALHLRSHHDELHRAPPLAGDGDDVPERGAVRAGHHGDSPRQRGQRTLAGRIQQPVGLERRADPFEFEGLGPDDLGGDDVGRGEAVLALLFPQRRLAADQHLGPVGRHLAEPRQHARRLLLPEHAPEGGVGVAQGEVPVAAPVRLELHQLAVHPDRLAEDALDRVPGVPVDLPHRPRLGQLAVAEQRREGHAAGLIRSGSVRRPAGCS